MRVGAVEEREVGAKDKERKEEVAKVVQMVEEEKMEEDETVEAQSGEAC